MNDKFSIVELALEQFVKMDAAPLVEYNELCDQALALLEQQKPDTMGNIDVPKSLISRVLITAQVLAVSMLGVKNAMTAEPPVSVEDHTDPCRDFAHNGKKVPALGDIVYFRPRCCPFGDVPPGIPFVVSDNAPDVYSDDTKLEFPAKFAVELAFLDKQGSVRTSLVDRRRLTAPVAAV